MIMTASDQTKDWGDLEKAMVNKPVESMDREQTFIPSLQIQFLGFIVIPVYRALSDMGMNRISDAGLY